MNGPNGGPIHAPADPVTVYFQAGVNLLDVRIVDGAARIRFGAYAGRTWQVEASDALPATNWVAVGDPIVGDDQIREVADATALGSQRFYRVTQVVAP